MNRVAISNEILQAFSSALEAKFIIPLRVKCDFGKETLSMYVYEELYISLAYNFKSKGNIVLTWHCFLNSKLEVGTDF